MRLGHGPVALQHVLAVLLKPLHDEAEGVIVLKREEGLDDKGRGAEEEDFTLSVQTVEPATRVIGGKKSEGKKKVGR